MQFSEIQTRVREYLEDENSSSYQWSATIVKRYINDAVRDFARRTKCYKRLSSALSASATTPTSAFYTLPTDLLEIEAVQDTVHDVWLVKTAIDLLPGNWETDTGNPYAYLFGDFGWSELRVYPYTASALTGLRVYYSALPADMTLDANTPTGIPDVYHSSLVYYAVAACYRRNFEDNDVRKAAEFQALYERDVADAMGRVGRKMDGTPVIVPYRNL